MNSKALIFCLLVLIYFSRGLFLLWKNKSPKYLLISFFLISVPLHYSIPILSPEFETQAGTLGTQVYIHLPLILLILSAPFIKYKKFTDDRYYGKGNHWMILISILIVWSLVNPAAPSKYFVYIFAIFFFSHIFFFKLVLKGYDRNEIIKGVFDGFSIMGVCQFLLAICWPVLKLSFTLTLFNSFGERTGTRMGSRPGAIGLFPHPGSLALFTIISLTFFLACYLNNYNKKITGFILFLNLATLFLTYSRTAYLVCIIDLALVYFISKNPYTPLFNYKNIFRFIVPSILILCWIIFLSPLSSLFLESDINAQMDNRMTHWTMAKIIFPNSPLAGVGINSHLEYMSRNFSLFNSMKITDPFFWEQPIHNIHLLILVETGLVGLSLWFIFTITSILNAKKDIANDRNKILSLSSIGLITAYLLYGLTGWAPLSDTMFPYFLFFSFFCIKFRYSNLA